MSNSVKQFFGKLSTVFGRDYFFALNEIYIEHSTTFYLALNNTKYK